jgi:hypothetical protein
LSTACVTEERDVGRGWEAKEIRRKEVLRKTALNKGFALLRCGKAEDVRGKTGATHREIEKEFLN